MSTPKYPPWVQSRSDQMIHDDFKLFLYALWKHLGLPPPTRIQLAIADYLQNGPKRRMIQAFRGVGKSWITAAFTLWRLYRDPDEKILVISASETKSLEFATFVKGLINEVPFLTHLRPRPGQRDSVLAFDVGPAKIAQAPSVRAAGILGQITGGRATLIIPDDVEIPGNSETEVKREKLKNRIAELGGAILVPEGGEVVYLGTPQSVQTIYSSLPERGYDIRIWPARYTDGIDPETGAYIYLGEICPILKADLENNPDLRGKPTEPPRFSELELLEREAEYGPSGFRLQFMLDTSLSDSDRYPLKLRDLIVMDLSPEIAPVQLAWASSPDLEWKDLPNVGLHGDRLYRPMYKSEHFAPYTGSVMFIDPSGRGADETAYCVTKFLNGWIYVRRWGGLKGGYDAATLKALATIARDEKVNAVYVEENYGDGMFSALLAPVMQSVYPVRMEEFKVTGVYKEKRICDKLEPALASHRVVIDREAARANSVATEDTKVEYLGLRQLAFMTRDRGALRHDDRVDILAEAVGFWVEHVDRATENAEQLHRDKLMLAEIRKHQAQCKRLAGTAQRRPSFVRGTLLRR